MKRILYPFFTNQKSFYDKAYYTVEGTDQNNNKIVLYSYNIKVCYIDEKDNIYLINTNKHTKITRKHIIEFLRQFINTDITTYTSLLKDKQYKVVKVN